MITRNSNVIVLGAGSSQEYGFPSGASLIDEIINLLVDASSYNQSKKRTFLAFLLWYSFEKNKLYKECVDCVNKFAELLINSSAASIDDFLDKISTELSDPLVILGKGLITLVISRYEDEKKNNLSLEQINNGPNGISFKSRRGWYSYLWKKLYEDGKEAEFISNLQKVTFITFNYDRSLEYFLFTRLISLFNKTAEEAASILNENLIMHHVYGSLGLLDWQTNVGNKYSINSYEPIEDSEVLRGLPDLDPMNPLERQEVWSSLRGQVGGSPGKYEAYFLKIFKISKGLKTYTEASKLPEGIIMKIQESQAMFFLGCAYHQQNIKLFPGWTRHGIDKFVSGTSFDLGIQMTNETIVNRLKQVFGAKCHYDVNASYKEYKIQDYFENVRDL